MKPLSRRDLIKTSLLAPAAVAAAQMGPLTSAIEASVPEPGSQAAAATPESPNPVRRPRAPPPRLRLAFPFRPCRRSRPDFGYGSGRTGNFQKTGSFLPAGNIAFDDSEWRPLDLPHDWAIELPFENDPALSSKGYYPLGRTYPATSVGWYRRVFELSRLRRRQAHHHRVRRLLSRNHGRLQRLLHRPPQRRIRSLLLRRDRLRQSRRTQRAARPRRRHHERRLVLRRRRHLPPRVAREDASRAREAVGHVRHRRSPIERRPSLDSHRCHQSRPSPRRTRALSRQSSIPRAKPLEKLHPQTASIPEAKRTHL